MVYDERTADRVRAALAKTRAVREQKLMGGLCFLVRGNMCCSVGGKGGLLIRVGPEGMTAALARPHTEPMRMGRKVMTGFVRVKPEGYRTASQLKAWIARGVECAERLPKKAPRSRKPKRSAPDS